MNTITNTNTNTNVPHTKPLTRKQKKRRRYRQYLKQKKLEKKYGFAYDDFDEDPYYDEDPLSRLVAQIYAERNSETHKQKIYDELDKFIAENKPTEKENIGKFEISIRDYNDGKKMYNEMKNDPSPNPKYEIFGSNGCGHQCFGLYKSKDQNMYIIEVRIQTPTNYIKIEDENLFN
jgi:hypothetical protein